MSRVAILCDDHFGCRNDTQVLADNLDKFYLDVFWPYLDNNNIKEIFHLGDLFDRRKFVTFQTANRLRRSFTDQFIVRNITTTPYYRIRPYQSGSEPEKFTNGSIFLTILTGNHDLPLRNKTLPNGPREMLPRTFNIRVANRPTELIVGTRKFLFVPWICDDNRAETLWMLEHSEATVVMGHLEIMGFPMDRTRVSDKGMAAADFARFEAVYSGHFHHQSSRGNIRYLGATREQTWADVNDPRGFHVLDSETLDLEFIPNPHTVFSKVTYGTKPGLCQVQNKIVKVEIAPGTEPGDAENFVAEVNSLGPASLRVVDHKAVKQTDAPPVAFDEDMLSLLVETAKEQTEVDVEPLKEVLSDLYAEARELET